LTPIPHSRYSNPSPIYPYHIHISLECERSRSWVVTLSVLYACSMTLASLPHLPRTLPSSMASYHRTTIPPNLIPKMLDKHATYRFSFAFQFGIHNSELIRSQLVRAGPSMSYGASSSPGPPARVRRWTKPKYDGHAARDSHKLCGSRPKLSCMLTSKQWSLRVLSSDGKTFHANCSWEKSRE